MPIKEVIKEKFNTGTIKPEKIDDSIKRYKYVSIDIFDTLLKRNVQKPTFEIERRDKIVAGVVLFNPDKRTEECLSKLNEQVTKVYIFDNSTKKTNIELPAESVYLSEGENKGIAYALNRIMERARADGYEWVLTMDQDSILPDGMVDDFSKHLDTTEIGIICPQVVDKRRAYMEVQQDESTEYIDMCITSASCTSIKVWEKIGRFDEWLFIDLVDNEFCKRLVESGYKILQLKKWILDQEFGKIEPKSERIQKFWLKVSKVLHNQNFAKFSYKKSVSSLRVYYTCRNIIYVNRKMKNYGKTAYENYNCKGYFGFVISFILPSILRADKKAEVIKAAWNGTMDGRKKKVEEWKAS